MKLIAFSLLFLTLATVMAQDPPQLVNPPEFKLAFDYNLINTLQANILEPLISSKLQNFTLNNTFSIKKGPISATIDNISLSAFSLDWTNTRILTLNSNNQPTISIQNLNLTIQFDADIKFLGINFHGQQDQISIVGMDLEIALGFDTLSNETTYAYIASVTPSIQTVNTHLSPSLEQFLVTFIEKFGSVFGLNPTQIVCSLLTNTIVGFNSTIIQMSTAGLDKVLLNLLEIQLSLADTPVNFVVGGDAYQAFSFNFEVSNAQTGETAPTASSNELPNYIDNGLPLQLIISEDMISQLLWAVFQTGKVNLWVSKANSPAFVPVKLDTTDLVILFPDLVNDFGADYGVYLNVQKGGDYPIVFVRDGRLVVELALLVDLYVDQDDAEYPVAALANCTDCAHAMSLNVSAFVAADVFAINSSFVGANVMDVILSNVDVLNGTLDVPSFQTTLNGMLVPLLGGINTMISGGFQNPIIGLFGINAFGVELGQDYLSIGLNMGLTEETLVM